MENHDALSPVQALLMSGTASPATTTPTSIRIQVLETTAAIMIQEPKALLERIGILQRKSASDPRALQTLVCFAEQQERYAGQGGGRRAMPFQLRP